MNVEMTDQVLRIECVDDKKCVNTTKAPDPSYSVMP